MCERDSMMHPKHKRMSDYVLDGGIRMSSEILHLE